MRTLMKKGKVVAGLTGLMLAGGIAFAAWTATGTGSGFAEAINAQAVVTGTATTTAQLYPGNNNGDVKVTFNNPNPYQVTVTSISGNGTIVTTPTDATCDLSTGVTFDNQATTSLNVPGGSTATPGTATFTLTGAANMSNDSVNACQGEKFSIPISFNHTS